MATSEFWRDLAEKFRSLPNSEILGAEWDLTVGSNVKSWRLVGGDEGLNGRFETLAMRAASQIANPGTRPLMFVWLEAVQASVWVMGYIRNADGTDGSHHVGGRIGRICEASANYCSHLEAIAIQREFEKPSVPVPILTLASPPKETIATQLQRLRLECDLTEEALAEQVNMDIRSVQRHLAGETVPRALSFSKYEKTFSKLLNRKIVIHSMP
jgi:hypothetical protein